MITQPERAHELRHTQNFLKSRRLVEELVRRSSLGPDDVVYEIGAGKGRITACLAARCGRVIAVEQDQRLATLLRDRFAEAPHVAIHAADCRAFPLPIQPYKVFANIPFDITTPIIQQLTSGTSPPADSYLIVQREAAERFSGLPRESIPALHLKPWFEPTIVHHFARTDFDPAPRVEVALLRLLQRATPLITPEEAAPYRDFIVTCFTASRPLRQGLHLGPLGRLSYRQMRALGLGAAPGPSTIPFEGWVRLFRHFRANGERRAWQAISGAAHHTRRNQARRGQTRAVSPRHPHSREGERR